MTVKDLSHLPTANKPEGLAPDDDPVYVRMLVEEMERRGAWSLEFDYDVDKPQVSDTMSRHSSANSCLKAAALNRDGVERDPMDPAGLWVTFLGTMAHDAFQSALSSHLDDDVEFEVGSTFSDLTSGSCDALVHEPEPGIGREVIELKTCGGFLYKLAIGERGVAQGPKSAHLVQLALNVVGHDADRGTIVYLSTEAVSIGAAERKGIDEWTRFGAQWSFSREHLEPLADAWLERLAWVRDHETDETPRFWPDETPLGARIVDPNSSRWELRDGEDIVDTGSVWGGSGCLYCNVRTACIKAWADGR